MKVLSVLQVGERLYKGGQEFRDLLVNNRRESEKCIFPFSKMVAMASDELPPDWYADHHNF